MNEVKFVKFWKCVICYSYTDMFCVSCDRAFCQKCLKYCVQCAQAVCEECYKEDKCCLVRPWGEKTEICLRDFYQNKLVRKLLMRVLENDGRYGNEHRSDALRRTIVHDVDFFDADSLSCCKAEFVRDFFPSITKYVDESCERFVEFMQQLLVNDSATFANLFLNNAVREELFSLMNESIRTNQKLHMQLVHYSLSSIELFDAMKSRGLLDWDLVDLKEYYKIQHLDTLKWIMKNGVDVVHNEEHFKHFARFSPPEILEYLLVEKGMTVEYMLKNILYIQQDGLKMVYRVEGMEGLQRIDPGKMVFDFETWKFLNSIGYKFDKISPKNVRVYPLVCFKIMKYEDLVEQERKNLDHYVKTHDIKACKHMYRYMKEIRKRKIMTVILCIRKTYPRFQKEIIWNILDYAYSPINERGPL